MSVSSAFLKAVEHELASSQAELRAAAQRMMWAIPAGMTATSAAGVLKEAYLPSLAGSIVRCPPGMTPMPIYQRAPTRRACAYCGSDKDALQCDGCGARVDGRARLVV